jgi:hypothetical protein
MTELMQPTAWLSTSASTVLLCGEEHGAAWAQAQGGRGRLLDLAEGAKIGGEAWAGSASTAKRLVRP